MTHVHLLMAAPGTDSLDAFAAAFFDIVAVDSFDERQNSHYAEGRYFLGQKRARSYKVMLTDDDGHSDVPYWVRISAAADAAPIHADEVDALARRLMYVWGFKVARVANIGHVSEERTDYVA